VPTEVRPGEAHRHRRKEPRRAAVFWNPRRRISSTALRKDFSGGGCKTYLPGQTPKFGGLDGKDMFDDTGGLEPGLQNVDCCCISAGEGKKGLFNEPSVGMYFFAVIRGISSR
jgi:hypothetical protein